MPSCYLIEKELVLGLAKEFAVRKFTVKMNVYEPWYKRKLFKGGDSRAELCPYLYPVKAEHWRGCNVIQGGSGSSVKTTVSFATFSFWFVFK